MKTIKNVSGIEIEVTAEQESILNEVNKYGFYELESYAISDDEEYLVVSNLVDYDVAGKSLIKINY